MTIMASEVAFASCNGNNPPTITSVSPAYGSITGGTVVTILGTSLGCVSVSFDNVAATSVNASYGTVTATSPSGSQGVISLRVTNPNVGLNANAFDTAQFTYITTATAPTLLVATAGDGQVSVAFTAPSSNGGSAITDYKYQLDGGSWVSASTTTSPVVITGLTNGTNYSIKLRAVNAAGDGAASSALNIATSSLATASATIIQSDVARVSRGAINANNKMVSQGLARFLADRESGIPLAESVSSSGMSSFKIEPNVTPINNGQGLSLNGIFGGTTTDGTYRRVTFGEFDIQHEPGSGTTLNFSTRLAWERAAGADAMLAYFVGAELNNSTISSTYTGIQSRYGVTAGMYGVKALNQNLYAVGYGSYGIARNNLNITDGTTDISGSYNTRSFGLGAQISGTIDQASYKIRPSVSLNFMQTWVGDVSLSSTAAGATSTITASVGNTNTLELLATPEFLFPVEVGNSSDAKVTASVAPRLICERNYGAGAVTKKCGAGAQLGLNQVSADGSTNLNASVRLDRIGGVNRRGLNLQAELRF